MTAFGKQFEGETVHFQQHSQAINKENSKNSTLQVIDIMNNL